MKPQNYAFDTQNIVSIQPEEWDLSFSKYTEFNVPHPNNPDLILDVYLVTGVLQNNHIEIAIDTENIFEEISYENIINYSFSNSSNTIGYDWKSFDFLANLYSVNSDKIYIIKDYSNYYKLRIIGYYNDIGEQGCINFEIQKL